MKVLRAERYATVPWRNGGGTTREIAVHYDLQKHEDFLWRVSIATVAQSGPFSRFNGVDRTIAVIAGEGMVLRSPDQVVTLSANAPPFAFDGEREVWCELLGQPTVDLNIMTRRGFARHRLRRESLAGWTSVEGKADETLVVANGLLELSARGRETLRRLDAIAEIAPGTTLELFSDRAAEIFIVELMID